ncbi:Probable carbohydrate esterase At4g34215 [Linum perenne]
MASPKQIFLLAGQSNMAGRGGVITKHKIKKWDGVIPPEMESHPEILRLTADMKWETAKEPLHADIDATKICGVGPGMAFSKAVKERLGEGGGVIGVVPCGVGGTAIAKWARGEELYENMVKRAKESVKCGGEGAEIKCLLWCQGESDTTSEHVAAAYRGNFEKLIQHVREDLGLPHLPVVQMVITSGDGKYVEHVREAQLGANIENLVRVDAQGLKLNPDNLHLTTESQVKLGHMMADAYITNFASPQPSSSPSA